MITPGMRFGKLTVVAYAYTKNRKKYFKCKCDCGNETVVRCNCLTTGRSRSCGCLSKEKQRERLLKNSIKPGTKFGKLTVIKLDHIDKHCYYQCKCECGNTKVVQGPALKSGNVKSCGCLKKKTKFLKKRLCPGEKFGKLTVIKFDHKEHNRSYYRCKCDCGTEKVIRGTSLTNGTTKSCGCLIHDQHNKRNKEIKPGTKFGKLTVVKSIYKDKKIYYSCKCDCGNETTVLGTSLINGNTKSCGCYQKEFSKTHGMKKTNFYIIWQQMKQRCLNPNHTYYKDYGKRGITVCQRWLDSFENFRDDMYESYQEHIKQFGKRNTSIDRIDVNGNYCPENCRWATCKEQVENRRITILVRENKNHPWQSLRSWCEEHNENYNTWFSRRQRKSKLFILEEKRNDDK